MTYFSLFSAAAKAQKDDEAALIINENSPATKAITTGEKGVLNWFIIKPHC